MSERETQAQDQGAEPDVASGDQQGSSPLGPVTGDPSMQLALKRRLAARRDEGGEGADGGEAETDLVSATLAEAKLHPESAEVKENLEHMTIGGLDRVIKGLKADAKAKTELAKIIKEAGEIKEKKEAKKELTPHAEKGDGWSGAGYKGDTKKDFYQKDLGNAAFTGEKNGSVSTFQTGGKELSDYLKDEKKKEKAEEKEQRKGEGFVAKHTHVGGTFAKKEGTASVSAVEGKTELGEKDGWGGSAHAEALSASAKGSASVGYDRDKGLTANASGSVKATLASAGAEVHAKPLHFAIAGEQFIAEASASVDSYVGAEAKGAAELSITPKGGGAEINLSAFAGAKIEGAIKGSLSWVKKSGADYAQDVAPHAQELLAKWIPASVANRLPPEAIVSVLTTVLPKVLGSDAGDALILGAEAKGSASAGIGAEANAGFSFKGGVIKCHGNAGLTVGLGASGSLDISLGAFDGMRCLAVLLAKGAPWVAEHWKPAQDIGGWLRGKTADAKAAIADYCQKYSEDPTHGRWARLLVGQVPGLLRD